MQVVPRSKEHFHLSTGSKHFRIAVSRRTFLLLMKQLSMSNYVLNKANLSDDQNPPCMNAAIEDLITAKKEV